MSSTANFPVPSSPYLFLSAGELSGDRHGAHLAAALRSREAEVLLAGLGGRNMQSAGVSVWADLIDRSAIGIWENASNVLPLRRLMKELDRVFRRLPPRGVVLIDYQGFNMRLARLARHLGIPTIYYICPQEWIWGFSRGPRRVAQGVDRILAVFQREAEVYRAAGGNVSYIGHPLLDTVPQEEQAEARQILGLTDSPVIGLMPGSRRQEIKKLTLAMLGAASLLQKWDPATQFILPLADPRFETDVRGALRQAEVPVKLVVGESHRCMSAADVLITASGTATLEAAIVGTPMVAVYKLSAFSYHLARWLLKFPFATLPNIVLERPVIPELYQKDVNPQRLADEVWNLLTSEERRRRMVADLAEVRERLKPYGAVTRAAEIILETLKKDP